MRVFRLFGLGGTSGYWRTPHELAINSPLMQYFVAMGGPRSCGLCARIIAKLDVVVVHFERQTFEIRPITQPFPHHHWEIFPTKMNPRMH